MSNQPRALAARTLGALSVLLAVVLATGAGASAASTTVRDATGDVYTLLGNGPTKASGPDGDITSVTVRHSPRLISIRVHASHLSLDQTMLQAKVRTGPHGPVYFFTGTADIGMRIALMSKGQEKLVMCPGIRMVFRPARGYVEAGIPRRCVGDPRWVRVGAALVTTDSLIQALGSDGGLDDLGEGETPSGTIDIAGVGTLSAAQMNATSMPLPLGPKVRVG